jgi:hypothetical protein
MEIRTERRGSFRCTGSDGNGYVVDRIVNIHTETLRGKVSIRDGETVFRCNGHAVGRIAKGHYRTWTGVDLKARDPHAP